jgi:hypothetical protein
MDENDIAVVCSRSSEAESDTPRRRTRRRLYHYCECEEASKETVQIWRRNTTLPVPMIGTSSDSEIVI